MLLDGLFYCFCFLPGCRARLNSSACSSSCRCSSATSFLFQIHTAFRARAFQHSYTTQRNQAKNMYALAIRLACSYWGMEEEVCPWFPPPASKKIHCRARQKEQMPFKACMCICNSSFIALKECSEHSTAQQSAKSKRNESASQIFQLAGFQPATHSVFVFLPLSCFLLLRPRRTPVHILPAVWELAVKP